MFRLAWVGGLQHLKESLTPLRVLGLPIGALALGRVDKGIADPHIVHTGLQGTWGPFRL